MLSPELQKKVDRAIRLLQSITPPQGESIEIAYSGGKDSDVILRLAKEAGIKYRAIYKNTTIDPPGTIKHAKEMGAEIDNPQKTFIELIHKKGYPTRIARFCCEYLKERRNDGFSKTVIGVRKAESRQRNERYKEPTQCIGTKRNPREAIYPILDWTDSDIEQFIYDRNIKCHPLYYDENDLFHVERRLGCLCCPLIYYKKRIEEFKAHPNMVKLYIKAGQKFRDDHPTLQRVVKNANVYEWFVRELFFGTDKKWQAHKESNALFGTPDYKQFLEDYFGIDLTLPNT